MRGLPIPRYPQLKLGLPSKKELIRAWTHKRPDVVHIATEGPLGWSALQAARYLRLPVTSDFRTNFHAYSEHYGVGWLRKPMVSYLRKFHNLTQLTMVPTRALRAQLMEMGFENVQVVARGVDTKLFNPQRRSEALRREWGAGPDSLVMLVVGGWESTAYALDTGQRSRSLWRPYMAPVKIIMTTGMALMLLQSLSELCKDIARALGHSFDTADT